MKIIWKTLTTEVATSNLGRIVGKQRVTAFPHAVQKLHTGFLQTLTTEFQ